MSSIRGKISSRLNGALSKGPIIEAGKRRSCQNAISHGLLAETIVSDLERSEGFFGLVDQHMATLNGVELVEEMCAAQWRSQRAWFVENGLFNQALKAADAKDVGFKESGLDRLVEASRQLSGDGLLDIYEGRLHRRYHRAIQTLLLLRRTRNPTSILPPNPNPRRSKNQPW